MTQSEAPQAHTCYIERFPHALPHRDEPAPRPCGHYACEPHTITYYGTGAENDQRVGEYHTRSLDVVRFVRFS